MRNRLIYLYQRYLADRCTEEELAELANLLEVFRDDPVLHDLMDETWKKDNQGSHTLKGASETTYSRIVNQKQSKTRVNYYPLVAAIALFTIGIFIYLHDRSQQFHVDPGIRYTIQDILPGSDKAVVTLRDGRQVALDDLETGFEITTNGLKMKKKEAGILELSFIANQDAYLEQMPLPLKSVRTPLGGEFKIILPEGSLVHLNAASILSFPDAVTDKERSVMLEGEAYFDIKAKRDNEKRRIPFTVKTAYQDIMVFGTTFNIKAYEGETTRTSLFTGSVKVKAKQQLSRQAQEVLLKPGEQAANDEMNSKLLVNKIDIEEEMAWKDGYFIFNHEHIKDIMEKIAKWYDIEVSYEGPVEPIRFFGIYDRSKSLKSLLDHISKTEKVRFKMFEEGSANKKRRVMVIADKH